MRFAALLFAASALYGAGTTAWEMNSYDDFIKGRFEGVSLSRDGRLTVAPRAETLFTSDQPIVWSLARGPGGVVYAATGHGGKLYEISAGGQSKLLWTADQPEIFALAVDAAGALYAATSPDGKVYKITAGKAVEYFAPGARYIWSLAVGPDGALYAGTGDQGRIFRITAAGQGEVYYETGQAHVTSLAVDRQGLLLAGSEPNGILYRVTAKGKAFVLYDANLPEIRSIVTTPDGAIYAAALGGSVARRAQSAAQAAQGATAAVPVTTITVTAEAQAGADVKPAPPQDPAAAAKQAQAAAAATGAYPGVIDLTGVEKSALFRINPDNTVETLWSSKEENIYDLATPAGQILFATDGAGRIYRMSPDRQVTLIAQTNEAEATRLLADGRQTLAATGNLGKVYRLGDGPGSAGSYESPVHDAGSVARWGRLNWRAGGGTLTFRTRTGNSLRPDQTWSDWSAPASAPSAIASPNARYIQWSAALSGPAALDGVTVAYVPQNTPPVVRSVNVIAIPAPVTSLRAPQQQSSPTAAYSITVTDTGDAGTTPSSGTPTQTLVRASAQQINISWLAEDPDGDRLVYNLYFRGEDEREWKRLKSDLREAAHTIDGDALADGRYFFRVTASDREANPAASARDAELISSPVLIDNTPPATRLSAPRRIGPAVEIDIEASDAESPLRRCEYSVDAGPWTPVEAKDGVVDSQQESFMLRLENLAPGEHVIAVRAIDSAGNAGLAKAVAR